MHSLEISQSLTIIHCKYFQSCCFQNLGYISESKVRVIMRDNVKHCIILTNSETNTPIFCLNSVYLGDDWFCRSLSLSCITSIEYFYCLLFCWASPGWQPNTNSATCSLLSFRETGTKNTTKNLLGQNKGWRLFTKYWENFIYFIVI